MSADYPPGSTEERVASYRNPELQAIFGVTLIAVLGVSSIAPALPRIAEVLGVTAGKVGLLVTAFTLPGVLLTTVAGILADRYGRLRVLLPGLILFAIAGTACFFAESLHVLIGLRVVQGVGASAIGSINVTLIGDLFVDRQRTTAMGLNASVLSVGTAAYPAVGGALAMIAWSAPFALALLALPVAVLAMRRLQVAPKGDKIDPGDYFRDLWGIVRRRDVLALFFASTSIFILLYGAYITFLPFLMAQRFGSTSLGIGLLMAFLSISTAITSANLGRLAAQLGEVKAMLVGFVVFAGGLALVPLVPSVWMLAVPAVLLGFAFATTIPVVMVLLTAIAPVDRRGAVMSLNGTVLRLGQTLGPPVMATVHRVAGINAVFFFSAFFALSLAALMAWAVPSTNSEFGIRNSE
ncbi:MAG: MFS transporter [Acidobacteria bacterium]|nr:MFS transporter [Acidobacteriota bacterium]